MKTTYIALDTNIWIYLTKDAFFEIWQKLQEMSLKGEIRIFINELILLEWDRNKETTIRNLTNNIKTEYTSAKGLSNYFKGQEKDEFLAVLSKYRDESFRIDKAQERVNEVESFMKKCVNVPITDAQKLFISNLATTNKPPFQNRKNNFNDALIIRSLCEYIVTNNYVVHDLLYVSNNPDDFIDKSTKKLFPELLYDLKTVRVTSVTDLGQALNLAPSLIDDIDHWLESQLDMHAMIEFDISRGK